MTTRLRPSWPVLVPIVFMIVNLVIVFAASRQRPQEGRSPVDGFVWMILGLNVLTCVVMVAALLIGRRRGWVWWPALVYAFVTGLASVALNISNLTTNSSLAAIGFVFVPVYQLLGMIPVALLTLLVRLGYRASRGNGDPPNAAQDVAGQTRR